MEALQKIILTLGQIAEHKERIIADLQSNVKTLESENQKLTGEFQDLQEEARKCCNFVAHMKKK